MKYLTIIQARCGSSRLPNKIFKDLGGKPDLQRVIERINRSKYVDEVIVATTLNVEDLQVVRFVSDLGYRVFAGSSDDVLDRYYQVAKLIRPEYVVRITADCPVIDPSILDDAISKMDPEDDYCAAMTETLADGLDIEILKFDSLEKSWKEAKLASEREHVTLYIKNHPELFKIKNYECTFANLHDERWTLDEEDDYRLLCEIYKHFMKEGREYFSAKDIFEFLNQNSDLRKINSKIMRNEGLKISLEHDHEV